MYYKNVLNSLTYYWELILKIGRFFLYIKKKIEDRKNNWISSTAILLILFTCVGS